MCKKGNRKSLIDSLKSLAEYDADFNGENETVNNEAAHDN